MSEQLVISNSSELRRLFKEKLMLNGMPEAYADRAADVLVWADERGIHSHGSVRMQYYSERCAKGGFNNDPELKFEKTGPSTGVYHGDNAVGHYVAYEAMEEAVNLAKESGIGAVGVSEMSHSGAIGYLVHKAAGQCTVAYTVCQ